MPSIFPAAAIQLKLSLSSVLSSILSSPITLLHVLCFIIPHTHSQAHKVLDEDGQS